MAKMGYVEGQGLGATGRGRLAPIETQSRPLGAGLGAVKEKTTQAKDEEKREAAFRGEVLEDSSEEERKRKRKQKEQRMLRRTGGAGIPRARPKLKYRTATELEAAADGLQVPDVLKSIIDATGSETKVLTSAAGLMTSQTTMVPSETESMKIARRARRDLEAFADEWNSLRERRDFFEAQQIQLTSDIAREEAEARVIEDVIVAIQDLQLLATNNDVQQGQESTWNSITVKLENIEQSFQESHHVAGLQEIAVAAIHPLFRTAMSEWVPLQDPTSVVPYLRRLAYIVSIEPESKDTAIALQNGISYFKPQSKSTTCYESMIYNLWLPPVRSAIINEWDVYDPDSLIAVLKAWQSILPSFVMANVIDQLVVRRLTEAIAAWKPRNTQKRHRHSKPPHVWLFPWLEYLDEQHTDLKNPTGLLSDIKRKFKALLSSWDLTSGVLPGLDEWRSVLQSDLSNMLVRHLLPRLALHLSESFVVDPSDQDLTPLEDVLKWKRFFSLDVIAHLLRVEFFSKWHQTLHVWLTNDPNYEEISEWIQWWKEQLEESLGVGLYDLPDIASEWNQGLEMIDHALNLGSDAATQLPAPVTAPAPPLASQAAASQQTSKPSVQDVSITFKDEVEKWCEESGLLMFPLREADLQTGLPLFRITASATGKGGVVVYLKGDVVWARALSPTENGTRVFMPVGLDERLVARAEGR